ncbi:MAG: hypothetical protein AAGE52_35355 [Myxococcota bacterium]
MHQRSARAARRREDHLRDADHPAEGDRPADDRHRHRRHHLGCHV